MLVSLAMYYRPADPVAKKHAVRQTGQLVLTMLLCEYFLTVGQFFLETVNTILQGIQIGHSPVSFSFRCGPD